MKRIFKEAGWRSGLDIDFLPQVVHACSILYNILIDIKEVDFDLVFNEMDAHRALTEHDQARDCHEPLVYRSTIESSELQEKLLKYIVFQ
jgi:hypothetical protein